MLQTNKKSFLGISHNTTSILAALLLCIAVSSVTQIAFGSSSDAASSAALEAHTERVAKRLQRRLKDRGFAGVSQMNAVAAVKQRRELLQSHVSVELQADDGSVFEPWNVSLQSKGFWIRADLKPSSIHFGLDEKQIEKDINEFGIPGVVTPIDSTILDIQKDGNFERVITDHPAKAGFAYDAQSVASALIDALESKTRNLTIDLRLTPGRVINATDRDLGPLEHLAVGRSNFKGSGYGRISNVRKGLNERVHGILIPPGGTFSFNESLGPVTASRGWHEALGIFNATELRPVVGGGICQVATTVYRAALFSGLPVTQRKNHSIYVSYYEQYGVGIDATVFQGKQDMRFINDTQNYILLQSYTDGFEAYVHVYGQPDGRSVALNGPFFSSNAPAGFNQGSNLRSNEIGWDYDVTYADGTSRSSTILSRYNSIPRSLVTSYAEPTLHTAAPLR